ncbi:hypothetical protein COV93_05660 [Candidatus Woesearchaeota archaeon CG11_big_fil_rev_8_21_14_0_20_43_8]|nr:MAG: hypothetical protein COV93_05660 [Candidatus Woesearchaeota archaeon CG11_big_fil_rev_8_21_14_0_20_43_8]
MQLKEIDVDFSSDKVEKKLKSLEGGCFEEINLFRHLSKAIDELKINPVAGVKMQHRLWPKQCRSLDLDNLYKYDLPNGWRLIYTIKNQGVRLLAVIIEWLSHKAYEKRFKYLVRDLPRYTYGPVSNLLYCT